MDLAKMIASVALLLIVVIAAGYAKGEDGVEPTQAVSAQKRIEEREAKRKAEIAEHQKRKEDLSRHCTRPLATPADLEACRAVYRKM